MHRGNGSSENRFCTHLALKMSIDLTGVISIYLKAVAGRTGFQSPFAFWAEGMELTRAWVVEEKQRV